MSDDLIRDSLNQLHDRMERMEAKIDAMPADMARARAEWCSIHLSRMDSIEKRIATTDRAVSDHGDRIGNLERGRAWIVAKLSLVVSAAGLIGGALFEWGKSKLFK